MEVMQVISDDVLARGDMIINVVALGFETYVEQPIICCAESSKKKSKTNYASITFKHLHSSSADEQFKGM